MSLRLISSRSGLSRNTVKKYVSQDISSPNYSARVCASKLDVYKEMLTTWLSARQHSSRKQRKTLKQLYVDLVDKGYTGSYDRVAAYAREWKSKHNPSASGVFIPLIFGPGEAFQFDWSEEYTEIGGERIKLYFAHTKLCYSRAFMVQAYVSQGHEMLFDAHNHAFSKLEGVPRRGIYDNMKTAVDHVQSGKERKVNVRFTAMASHYVFEAQFCTPAAGWEKGQVEKSVQDVRRRIGQHIPACSTLAELNVWLEKRCIALWSELKHPEQERTIAKFGKKKERI